MKNVYIGHKLLYNQVLFKKIEHCLLIIFNFIFSSILVTFLDSNGIVSYYLSNAFGHTFSHHQGLCSLKLTVWVFTVFIICSVLL